jgi:hypothetical protein
VHPEAASWQSRVIANGGSVSSGTLKAVSDFCKAVSAAGIRDRFYRLNLFCGNSDAVLAAVRTPLFRGPAATGTQFGNETDTMTSFQAADYAENSGLKGNGTTKYLDTGVLMTFLGTNQMHLFASFVPDASATFTQVLSARANQSLSLTLESVYNGTTTNRMRVAVFSNGQQPSGQPSVLTGRTQLLVNHSSGSLFRTFVKNEDVGNLTLGAYTAAHAYPFWVFAGNQGTVGAPSVASPTFHRIDSYSIGASFTTDAAKDAYHNALATFRSALGRT